MTPADLTVVLPTYNHAHCLPRALDAILAQSRPPREVLVVDDASTDDTPAVLDRYARRHARLRVVRNERNLGVVGAMNRGTALSDSRLLLYTASDDFLLPTFVEKAVELLDAHPHAGLACAHSAYRVGDDGPEGVVDHAWPERAGYYAPAEVCAAVRRGIPGHANVCRRDALAAAGGFLPAAAWYSDWLVLLTVAFRHGVCYLPETLAVTVLSPASYSGAGFRDRPRNVAALAAVLDRIASPDLADVAPYFRRNGSATHLGTDLIRAAAARPDRWSQPVLGMLNGFAADDYRGLLDDPDPAVRELAEFFLGPFWRAAERERADRAAEVVHLKNLLARAEAAALPPGVGAKLRWIAGRAARRLAG